MGGSDGSSSPLTSGAESSDPGDHCGDGRIDPGEQCDDEDLGGAQCSDFGLQGEPVECRSDCTFDLSECSGCGNGEVEGEEECDGDAVRGSCGDLGWEEGVLACTNECTLDESGCYTCGDGILADAEECDTRTPISCTKLGWDGGEAVCDSCTWGTTECCLFNGGICDGDSDCCSGNCAEGMCEPDGGGSSSGGG